MRPEIPLLILAGPTASGKTALALELASRLSAEIVSFDSVQLYRDFDLGTAKPTPEELARVPHHFIGEFDPRQPLSAGEYSRQARPRIRAIAARGRLPLLVGGSGFYLRALLEGLFPGPAAAPELRARLRDRATHGGPHRLHRLLRRLDPEAADKIASADLPKLIRALEVRMLARRPMSQLWREAGSEKFSEARPFWIGLNPPRARLYERIEARAAVMFAGGIQQETRGLLEIYPASLPLFQSHGYKQACDILLRDVPVPLALAEAQAEQRHYAKRQLTWFRANPDIHWLPGFGDDPLIQAAAWQAISQRSHGSDHLFALD